MRVFRPESDVPASCAACVVLVLVFASMRVFSPESDVPASCAACVVLVFVFAVILES